MSRSGMTVADVERLGRELQEFARMIEEQVRKLDARVNGVDWTGDDARVYKTEWWPQHKKSVLAAKESINGLGQSALNNANEQRQASSRR